MTKSLRTYSTGPLRRSGGRNTIKAIHFVDDLDEALAIIARRAKRASRESHPQMRRRGKPRMPVFAFQTHNEE